jgi:RNA polymerase sigma-70 factor, ECF subfamily
LNPAETILPAKSSETISESTAAEIGNEERELVRRVCEGDEQAIGKMVRQHAPRMLLAARHFLPREEDARDVVQNALLSAMKGIDSFSQQSRLATWLHRLVVIAALMKLRGRRSRVEDSIEDLLPSFDRDGKWQSGMTGFVAPDQMPIDRHETHAMVRRSIGQLPESYRTVLLIHDIEDLNTTETAQLLDITPNAANVRLHRARQALRPILERETHASRLSASSRGNRMI